MVQAVRASHKAPLNDHRYFLITTIKGRILANAYMLNLSITCQNSECLCAPTALGIVRHITTGLDDKERGAVFWEFWWVCRPVIRA